MVCPITNTNKEFPLHLSLEERTKTTGVVMCEQVKALNIYARGASYFVKAPRDIAEEALDIIFGFKKLKQKCRILITSQTNDKSIGQGFNAFLSSV